jgi:hypothetical protein
VNSTATATPTLITSKRVRMGVPGGWIDSIKAVEEGITREGWREIRGK